MREGAVGAASWPMAIAQPRAGRSRRWPPPIPSWPAIIAKRPYSRCSCSEREPGVIRSNVILGLAAAVLLLGLYSAAQRSSRPVEAAPPARSAGFKITFGVKQKLHGRSWAGVLQDPAQVRSMRGWHLDTGDTITPPTKWNI